VTVTWKQFRIICSAISAWCGSWL